VGEKYSPSLSPDGKQLAFAWNGGNGPFFSIYVKLIGTEEPLRLSKQESVDYNPVWSPDGRYIAFCRIQKGETGIYIVPALGGAARKVRDTHWEEREFYESFGTSVPPLVLTEVTLVFDRIRQQTASNFSISLDTRLHPQNHFTRSRVITLYFPRWSNTGWPGFAGVRLSTHGGCRSTASSPVRNTVGD
jgi:hypothetical protein